MEHRAREQGADEDAMKWMQRAFSTCTFEVWDDGNEEMYAIEIGEYGRVRKVCADGTYVLDVHLNGQWAERSTQRAALITKAEEIQHHQAMEEFRQEVCWQHFYFNA